MYSVMLAKSFPYVYWLTFAGTDLKLNGTHTEISFVAVSPFSLKYSCRVMDVSAIRNSLRLAFDFLASAFVLLVLRMSEFYALISPVKYRGCLLIQFLSLDLPM